MKVIYETDSNSFELELVKIQNKRLEFFEWELTDNSYEKLMESGFSLDSIVDIEKAFIEELSNK